MSKVTINSELDLYEKGGNSTHARWIADKFLKARQLGIISEVELAILDTSLADDFGSFKAYREGAASVDMLSSVEPLADVSNESTRDRCRRELKDVRGEYPTNHFDSHQSW